MTTNVDQRVVEMGFENRQFESGVQTSLKTLSDLKKGLNLGDSVRGLSDLQKAGRSFSLESMSDAIRTVTDRFSTLGIIGLTVIQNITNAVIGLGTQLVRSITVAPLIAGLNEYETQLNAIQTILANTQSKGTSLDQVNAALDELNAYSDKTIYNFTQMTKNIGTFTAAGIDLNTSVSAIKGIANLAAVSGSSAEQASVAMYQLSQALASGTIRLMDWNSVVNAGMGGQVFQDALKETARLHGIAIDQMIKDEGSFRETLQKGWLTSNILTETLAKFTGDLTADQLKTMGYTEQQIAGILQLGKTANDAATKVKTFSQLKTTLSEAIQSGWGLSFRIIIGDFEEAKSFFTEANNILSGMISASSDSRNNLLQGWKDLGGRTALIEAIRNTFTGLLGVIKPIKEAFLEIFPPITSERLYNLTKGLEELSRKFILSEETSSKLKRVFKGVAAILDIVREAISKILSYFGRLIGVMAPAGSTLLDFLANVGDYAVGLRDAIKKNDAFGKTFEKIGGYLDTSKRYLTKFKEFVSDTTQKIRDTMKNIFGSVDTTGIEDFVKKIQIRFEPLSALVRVVGSVFSGLAKIVKALSPVFSRLGDIISKTIGQLSDVIAKHLENMDFNAIFDGLNAGLLVALGLAIKNFVTDSSGIFKGISGILDSVQGSLESWQQNLKAKTLLQIAAAIAIMAAAIVAISLVDSTKLSASLTAMTVMFLQLIAAMAALDKIPGGTGISRTALSMITLSIAMLLLTKAVTSLAKLDTKALIRGVTGIQALTLTLGVFAKTMSGQQGAMIKGAASLVVFAFAIDVLAKAATKLGALDWDSLGKGLAGVGGLLAELAIFLNVTDVGGSGLRKSTGLVIVAGAVMILATAVEKFGQLDSGKMVQGLLGVSTILTELAIFVNLTGDSTKVITTATGLVIIGAAMLIFASAVEKMGSLSWEDLAKGILGMAAALAVIVAAISFIPPNIVIAAAGLLIVAAALSVVAKSLTELGGMSWMEVATSLIMLAGSLTIIAAALYAMEGALPGAAAMIVAAGAIAVLAPALKLLGSMSLEEIGLSLLALAGAFTVVGVAALVLTPLVPVLAALAVSMVLFGGAVLAMGIGVAAFAAGLTMLAAAGSAGAAALVLLISTILGLLPMIVKRLVEALTLFARLFAETAPVLAETLKVVLLSLIDVIITVIPPLVDAILLLVTTLLQALAKNLPAIIEAGMQIVIALLTGIANNIKPIVELAIKIVSQFILGLSQSLPGLIDAGFKLMISFINGLADAVDANLPTVMAAIGRLAMAIINGLVKGLIGGYGEIGKGMRDLGNEVIDGFKNALGIKSPSTVFQSLGKDIIRGLVNGIKAMVSDAKGAIRDVAYAARNELQSWYSNFVTVGSSLVSGITQGIRNYISKAVAAAYDLASQVIDTINKLLGIASPSKVMRETGMYLVIGLADGIDKYAGRVTKSAANLEKNTVSSFTDIIAKITDAINTNIDMTPKIRPVLDLSSVVSAGSKIGGLLAIQPISIGTSFGRARNISTSLSSNGRSETRETINPERTGDTISFTQINNSPKELSRVEIYRQTRNQLLQLKGAVKNK